MGFLSKVFKGIKKFVKKVGKGIKKVVTKFGAAVDKLGIVGQIGMMFLMPYAMGAMSGFFGQFAAGQAGTWAAKLASSNVFGAKALSTVMNAVHTAGTFIAKPFAAIKNGLGDTISGAVDWIAKKTGTTDIVAGVRNIMNKGQNLFGSKTEQGGFKRPSIDSSGKLTWSTETPESFVKGFGGPSSPEANFASQFKEASKGLFTDTKTISVAGDPSIFGTRSHVGTPPFKPEIRTGTASLTDTSDVQSFVEDFSSSQDPTAAFTSQVQETGKSLLSKDTFRQEKPTNFIDRIKDGVKDYVANFDVGAAIEQSVVRPALQGVGERVARKAAGDPGEQVVRHYTIPDLIRFSSDAGVFNEIDLAHQKSGNVWAATNYANHDPLKVFGDQSQLPGYQGIQLLAEQDAR